MFKEFRDVTLGGAVESMYNDMAGRHRVRYPCIQIIKTATLTDEQCKRPNVLQFHDKVVDEKNVTPSFPLTHKVVRPASKSMKTTFKYKRPHLSTI